MATTIHIGAAPSGQNLVNAGTVFVEAGASSFCQNSGGDEDWHQIRIPQDGVLQGIGIHVTANTYSGDASIHFRVNGVTGSGTLTIPAGTTGWFRDATISEAVSTGDLVVYAIVVAGSGGLTYTQIEHGFTADSGESSTIWSCTGALNLSSSVYLPVAGAADQNATESLVQVGGNASTLKNLSVFVRSGANTTDAACDVILRVNGSDTALKVTIPAGTDGRFTDTSNAVAINDGDLIDLRFDYSAVTNAGAIQIRNYQIEEVTATGVGTGISWVGGSFGAGQYFGPSGANSNSSTESDVAVESLLAFTLDRLWVRVTSNVNGTDTTLRCRINGSNGTVVVTIPAMTTGDFSDVAHSDAIAAGDAFDFTLSQTVSIQFISWAGTVAVPTPGAVTDPATNVTYECATLNGTFSPDGIDINGFFRWGPSNPPTEFETSPQAVGSGLTPVALQDTICGLTPCATYYYQAVAVETGSPAIEYPGSVVAFTVLCLPTALTTPVTNITGTTATLNGDFDPNGTDIDGFFLWGPENPPTSNQTTPVNIGNGLVAVSKTANISGLTPGVTYWVQAVASLVGSPGQLFYGNIVSFIAQTQLGPSDPILEGEPGLLAWMNWHVFETTGGSPSHGEAIYNYSDQDLHCPPDYYEGYKQARVKRFGPIERAFSDQRTGDWHGASCQIDLSDYDQSLRTRAASATQKFWTSSVVAVRMVSRAIRAIKGQALTVFVGPIRKANPEPVLSYRLELQDQVGQFLTSQLRVPQRLVDAAYVGFQLIEAALSHPEPIIYGQHAKTEGAFAPIYLGIDSATEHVWLVAGHACKAIDDIFIDGTSVLADVGTDWTIQTSIDLGGRRYCLLRGVVGNTNPDDAASGAATLTINVSGVEAVGDGSGALLTDGLLQYLHFAINYLSDMTGYQTGAWPASPPSWVLSDFTVPTVDVQSFLDASALSQVRYQSPTTSVFGYVGQTIIGATRSDRLLARDWIARWNLSMDVRFGVKRYGQMFVRMTMPTTADYTAAPIFTDGLDIIAGTFRVDTDWDEQFNRIPYAADYDYANGVFLAVGRDGEDLQAIADYQTTIHSPVRDYWMVPDSDQGKNVAEYEVLRTKDPPKVVQFETAIGRAANLELGDYIRVVHFAGVGPGSDRLYQVEGHIITPGKRRVKVRAVDVHDLIDVVVAIP